MFKYLLLNGVLAVYPVEPLETPLEVDHICALSESERDRLFREAQWCYTRAMTALEDAHNEISQLRDYSVRRVCRSAIEGAIVSFAGSGSKERSVITALTVVAKYVDDNVDHIWDAYNFLCDAKRFAAQGQRAEERLWRDQ